MVGLLGPDFRELRAELKVRGWCSAKTAGVMSVEVGAHVCLGYVVSAFQRLTLILWALAGDPTMPGLIISGE